MTLFEKRRKRRGPGPDSLRVELGNRKPVFKSDILGYTASKKPVYRCYTPIYKSLTHAYTAGIDVHSWYPDFNARDHLDAYGLHKSEGEEISALAHRIAANDLVKARTVGSKNTSGSKAKYGMLVSSDPSFSESTGGVRYLTQKDVGKLGEIMKRYAARGVNVQYISADTAQHFDPEAHQKTRDVQVRSDTYVAAKQAPKIPSEITGTQESDLAFQRVAEESIPMIKVLQERVANWTRPKSFKAAHDPLLDHELRELATKRRAISGSVKGKGGKEKALASQEYATIQRRIDAILGKKHATQGGGLEIFTQKEAQMIGAMPSEDIGINPTERPMSYLISLGWHKRNNTGGNVFNKNETGALVHEYGRLIAHTASQIKRKFELNTDETAEVRNIANLFLLEEASKWSVETRGDASKASNFQFYIAHTLPKRVMGEVIASRKSKGEEVYAEDLDDMPERNGRKLAPHARIETPLQHFQRKELSSDASHILEHALTPLEYATLISRLNIYDTQDEGIHQDKEVNVGVKPWTQVKADVERRLKEVKSPDASYVGQLPQKQFQAVFAMAMNKLRAGAASGGITLKERRVLSELADIQRLYLEGVRHETFDPKESFGKLKRSPLTIEALKVAQNHASELKDAYEKKKISLLKEGDPQSRREGIKQLAEMGREMLTAQAKVKDRAHRHVSFQVSKITHVAKMADYWKTHEALATELRIDTDYADYVTNQNVAVPKAYLNQRNKAETYYKVYTSLRSLGPDKLTKLLNSKDTVADNGVPDSDVRILARHALGHSTPKAMKKSFDITWQNLLDECAVWELNGV